MINRKKTSAEPDNYTRLTAAARVIFCQQEASLQCNPLGRDNEA